MYNQWMNDTFWQESILTKCRDQSKYSVFRKENVRRSQYELRNKKTPPSSHNLLSFLQEGAMRASWNSHRQECSWTAAIMNCFQPPVENRFEF